MYASAVRISTSIVLSSTHIWLKSYTSHCSQYFPASRNYLTLKPLPFDFMQTQKLFLWYPSTLWLPYGPLEVHIPVYIRNTWTATEGQCSAWAEVGLSTSTSTFTGTCGFICGKTCTNRSPVCRYPALKLPMSTGDNFGIVKLPVVLACN